MKWIYLQKILIRFWKKIAIPSFTNWKTNKITLTSNQIEQLKKYM